MEVKMDSNFEKELAAIDGDGATLCFQCGTCTAGCPSGRRTAYRVRKLIRMTQLDMREEIIDSDDLWMCTTCYTCEERCPRRVPIVDIIVALRNIAVKEGHMYPAHKKTAGNLYAFGHSVPINDKVKETRKRLGLAEVPPTVLASKKAFDDLKIIMDATNFKDIAEE